MSLPIFYTAQNDPADVFTLQEDTSRHVVQVLRMKPEEQLQLTDGLGNLLTVSILDDHKKKCTVTVMKRDFFKQKNQKVSIAISLLKNSSRFEWFVEKATELGVTEIVPLLCERTEKQHFRSERMHSILVAAMLQSQQYWLPALREATSFGQLVAESVYQTKLIAHCDEGTRRNMKQVEGTNTQILIGPEGDFSPPEIQLALQHGYEPVTLGSTRLRTETAGVAAACILCMG